MTAIRSGLLAGPSTTGSLRADLVGFPSLSQYNNPTSLLFLPDAYDVNKDVMLMLSVLLDDPADSQQVRTATKRGGGSSKNGRSSAGRRLGVKKFTGQSFSLSDLNSMSLSSFKFAYGS